MRALVALVTVALLTACLPLGNREPSPPEPGEALVDRLGRIDGVLSVQDGDPVVVEIDAERSPEELDRIAEETFEVTNDAGPAEGEPNVQLSVDRFTSDIGYEHDGGGPQPGPAALSWVPLLAAEEAVERGVIEHSNAHVVLSSGTDPLAWAAEYTAGDDEWPRHAVLYASMGEGATVVAVRPGEERERELVRAAVDVTGARDAELREIRWGTVTIGVRDAAHGAEVLADLEAAIDSDPDIVLASPALTWNGKLSQVLEQLSGDLGQLGELIGETGSSLVHTLTIRNSHQVEVPGLEELETLIELMDSPRWSPGPESMVSVVLAGSTAPHPSRLTAGNWPRYGPILADAHRAGLLGTVIRERGGGRRDRAFDVIFHSTPGADMTTPDGYGRAIEVLRAHSWEGEAQIVISESPSPVFWSTATGRAEGAYNMRADSEREPFGWGADWIAAWDATAE